MSRSPSLYLGASRSLDGERGAEALHLPAHHLTTHAVVVGMTGSGKTGLMTVLVEEALPLHADRRESAWIDWVWAAGGQ